MKKNDIIEKTKAFVREKLESAERGHDYFHALRVYGNAMYIGEREKADSFIIALGSLLHDIADAKFHDGDEEAGPRTARKFLENINVEESVIEHVENIIRHISFKNTLDTKKTSFTSPEFLIIQDADRLDAIGAIGIARAFHYGGYKNRLIYNPELKPKLSQSKEEYKNSQAPTIQHFYEKLLLLKDLMNTKTGKALAEERHSFMEDYLRQFYAEWNLGCR